MRFKPVIIFAAIFLLILSACKTPDGNKAGGLSELKKDTSIRYAKRFSIAEGKGYTMVYIFGNRKNISDTTAAFLISEDSAKSYTVPANITIVKSPCTKIAALSSIYATMFCELGCIKNIAAIDNIDYVNNKQIISKFNSGGLKELARMPEIDLEKTIILKPDMIFMFGMGEWEKDIDKKLQQTRIPVVISVDHLEEDALARAEWIKLFSVFVSRRQQADSIFNKVEKNYERLKVVASSAATKPTVFNEIKYSDSWYMPGGKSYVARMLKDAAANYLWKDDEKFGSLPLSFEQVYAKAKDADFWINLSLVKTKKELLAYESRYSEFRAFKTGNLYNNTKVTNQKGYSIYWETGMIHPDKILNDLILIFHPELKSKLISEELSYYEQIK
jgi:iron complex transport system substrate-binding protein